MTIQGLMESLRSYEQRLSRRNEKSVESTFQSKLTIQSNNENLVFQNNGESSRGEIFSKGPGMGKNSPGRGRGTYGSRINFGGSNKWCDI